MDDTKGSDGEKANIDTNNRKLWIVIIVHILKRHSTQKMMLTTCKYSWIRKYLCNWWFGNLFSLDRNINGHFCKCSTDLQMDTAVICSISTLIDFYFDLTSVIVSSMDPIVSRGVKYKHRSPVAAEMV